jgi:electron transport complex protein RnfB
MAENEVYDQLADMVNKEDIVGMPKTPAFLKLLSLQFTPAEAQLALHVHLTGGTLSEIATRSGMGKRKLKEMLNTMADKGTVYIEPGKKDPLYKVVGSAAPGLIETGLWGNIKYPFTIELGKALHQVLKEWSEQKLCKLGFPFAPVWAAIGALPADTQPSENLVEVLRSAGHWSTSPCPCRLSHWLVDPGNHCEHILETCIHTGDLSRWAVEHGMAREITFNELVELMRKCNENGLVHTLNINNCVCNCCNDCCAIFHGQNLGVKVFLPSPFIAKVDYDACNACGTCAERCPVSAIEVNDYATVNPDKCLGCGVCATKCDAEAIKLVRRTASVS